MSNLNVITDASWQTDVADQPGLVLVDFWAPWCAPCKAMLPSFTELADDYEGEVTLAKLNVDDNPQTATAQKVRGIPLLVMFRGGAEVGRMQGGSKSSIANFIEQHLQTGAA